MLAQMVFCPTIFTSQCHETSLWRSATWPTVFTKSRGNSYKRDSGLSTLLPLLYYLSQLLVWRVASRRPLPDLHTMCNNKTPPGSHLQLKPPDLLMACQGIKSATLRAGYTGAYCLLHYGKYGTVYFTQYVTRFNWDADHYAMYYFKIQIHGNLGILVL